jgi:hypothetical protein
VPIAPALALAAPPTNGVAARRYSILNAAVGPLDMPDGGRLVDVAYTVPWCGPGGAILAPDCDTPPPNVAEGPLSIVDGIAFTVSRTFQCTAHGISPADAERYMRDRLDASEHVLVERAVAAQLAAATPDDLGSGTTIVDVVSALENHAYVTEGYGPTAVIHMPIAGFAHLADGSQITRESSTGVWRTPLGTVIAPNAGLTTQAYVTGLLVLWRSGTAFIPPAEAALDRTTNEYKMVGQRDWIAAWECFTARITLGVLA